MGWKGVARSLAAEAKRADRERLKQQQLSAAAEAVHEYENYIDMIVSVHKECGPKIYWSGLSEMPAPEKPERSDWQEKAAQDKSDNYTPNFIEKLFPSLADRKKRILESRIEYAKRKDERDFELATSKYETDFAEWEKKAGLAKRVVAGDPESYIEVIREKGPFSGISSLGSLVGFTIDENGYFDVSVKVNADNIIPDEVYKLTKTGKLSVREMPKGKFNELYQDHICSSLFRLAREVFALLPVETIYAHANADMLNTGTGKIEEQTIISVAFVRETMDNLVFDYIDPSDALSNFVHNMTFKKTQGFYPVDEVSRLA